MSRGNRVGFINNGNAVEEQSKKVPYRHSSQQIHMFEEFFNRCPHPTKNQRQQLSKELGLDPKQVKFWFQNKRSQIKVRKERVINNALRAENEILHCENLELREALQNIRCPACSGTAPEVQNLQRLMFENACLKNELERVHRMLFPYITQPDAPQA